MSVCDPRENCRFCACNFRVKFGVSGKQGSISSENLFKPSQRKDSLGIILADICENVGIPIANEPTRYSDKVCNLCGRKIKNLGTLFNFVKSSVNSETPVKNSNSRKKRVLETPDKRSPSWRRAKLPCTVTTPQSRKSLFGNKQDARQEDLSSTHLNIDDLPKEGLQIKVLVLNPNGDVVVRIPRDEQSKNLIKHVALRNWKTAAKTIFKHEDLFPEIKEEIRRNVNSEFKEYLKSGSVLESTEPEDIASFHNTVFHEEIRVYCPVWYEALLGVCGADKEEMKNSHIKVNSATLATATLIRLRNVKLSAFHYRIATILFHSGTRFEDQIRLNRLGISMSPDRTVALQKKMGEQLEAKVKFWKKKIEENKGALCLCEEIISKQVPIRDNTDMDLCINFDTSKDTLKHYQCFTEDNFAYLEEAIEFVKKTRNEEDVSTECMDEIIAHIRKAQLPLFK